MVSAKLAFVALLAVFGCVQGTPNPREVDISVTIEEILKILGIVKDDVNNGIEQCAPHISIINEQFTPDVAEALNGVWGNFTLLMKNIGNRADYIIVETTEAMKGIQESQECFDPENETMQGIYNELFPGILRCVREAEKNYTENITNALTEIDRIVVRIRGCYDNTLLAPLVKCFVRGAPEANVCLNDTMNAFKSEVVSIVADSLLVVSTVFDVLQLFIGAIVSCSAPLVEKAMNDMEAPMGDVATCIASLALF